MRKYNGHFSGDGAVYRRPEQASRSLRRYLNFGKYGDSRQPHRKNGSGEAVPLERNPLLQYILTGDVPTPKPKRLDRARAELLSQKRDHSTRRLSGPYQADAGSSRGLPEYADPADEQRLWAYLRHLPHAEFTAELLLRYFEPSFDEDGNLVLVSKPIMKKYGTAGGRPMLPADEDMIHTYIHHIPGGKILFVYEKIEKAPLTGDVGDEFLRYGREERHDIAALADNIGEAMGLQAQDFDPDVYVKGRTALSPPHEVLTDHEEAYEPMRGHLRRLLETEPEFRIEDSPTRKARKRILEKE